nr:MAG TPA: hypothetical protein [Bacteriophage sp.]DAH34359.1 MAG TPA: hypothetical protein [Caudoviricetes sp.]
MPSAEPYLTTGNYPDTFLSPSDTESTEVKIQTQNERTFGVYLVFKGAKRSNMILNDIQIHSPRYRMKRAFFNDMQRYE